LDAITLHAWLAAWFAVAAGWHLARWLRRRVRTERLWFALIACVAGAIAVVGDSPAALTLSLLVAAAWFAAESPFGEGRRRAAALAATVFATFTFIATRILSLLPPATTAEAVLATLRQSAVFGVLAIAAGLALHGATHAWSGRRWRAIAVGLVGLVPASIAWQGFTDGDWLGVPTLALYAIALAAVPGMIEPWRVHADARKVRDFAHTSRLAVVGELTASIAHEINQPLGAILSNADAGQMLLERLRGEGTQASLEELGHILADIRRDGLRASGVIRHVRTLAGRRELTLERLDANALAYDTVRLLDVDMRRRRIAIDVIPGADSAAVRGDRGHLEQVLINLLLNAMDALDAHATSSSNASLPPIVLALGRTVHGAVEFAVIDAGHGIPEDRVNRLFHSFYSSKPHGMGLGLSIARSIVEAHGGWIRAENNHGPGATFRVTFPPFDERES
jgi:signal transduction histidine kinase